MLGTFNCKDAHQSDYCALCRRVGGLATQPEQAADGRHEDDLPTALCDEMWPGGLHRAHRSADVHTPIVIEIGEGSVLKWLAPADPSVVDEKIQSAEMIDRHPDQIIATFRSGNIGITRDRLAPT
jgi:hypothetical protein